MILSTVLPLILTVLTLIGVLMSPALQGAGALTLPSQRVRRSLITSLLEFALRLLVRVFGKPVTTPPATVIRAFHRGHNLVVLSDVSDGGRLVWSA